MNRPNDPFQDLAFFTTELHPCSYIQDQQAITLFADPRVQLNSDLYSHLIDFGFRRSGRFIYRPSCPDCNECKSIRVPVQEFLPSRNQKRCWKKNLDLHIIERPASFVQEHFDLYQDYIGSRHVDGGMETDEPQKYIDFLTCHWSNTRFVEFRDRNDKLLAVAVMDVLNHGLSAVYTFFDPIHSRRSLGTFAILWEIERCKTLNLPWLYLGFWIKQCVKMSYKDRFQPQQIFHDGDWIDNPIQCG